ncbi:MAG TPA: protoporphyrinogen oxidase, partial [Ktedonobacterales bacterium]
MTTSQPEAPAHASPHVTIIGGGISGLATAWYLEREAERAGVRLTYTLLEATPRFGGKVLSERVDGFGDGSFILEGGADAFLTRKPWALALARELGLGEQLHYTNQEHSRTYVLRHGKPVPLPDGLRLLAPTKLLPFLRSPLFTPWGKARIGLDLLIPPRQSEADESLAAFVRRRFGAEALDRVAEPMMAGVFNADAERQSLQATFPQFGVMEREHGSVIRGQRAAERSATPATTPAFFSFPGGTQTLADTLTAHLTGDLRAATQATQLSRREAGYAVTLDSREIINTDAVILASPASVAGALLREVAPEAALLLGSIRYHGIGALYLGYRAGDVPHPLDGYGVVIPTSEGRQIDGMTWSSTKWTGRAPSGYALLRVFFGGPAT